MSDFSSVTEPVARKQYICEDCQTPILKGEKHVKTVYNNYGDFGSYREHEECNDSIHQWITEFKPDDEDILFFYKWKEDVDYYQLALEWLSDYFPETFKRVMFPEYYK